MESVPSVEELKKICWRSPPDIYRKVSIYVVRFALMFGTRANHITFARFDFLIAGLICMFKSIWFQLLGVLSFQLVLFLDTMDGAIARYRKESSFMGEAMDLILDHISSSIVYFIAAGIAAYLQTGASIFLWISIGTIILSQTSAFYRALFIEFKVNVEEKRNQSRVFYFFHQDNMRFLLFALTLGVVASIFSNQAYSFLAYGYFVFGVTKLLILIALLLKYSGKMFSLKTVIAYKLGCIYLLAWVILGKQRSNFFRSFIEKKFSSVLLIQRLLSFTQ